MSKDLGTYHLLVELANGKGFIEKWNTGYRFSHGNEEYTIPNATMIPPVYSDEDQVFRSMVFFYTEGNGACDCYKTSAISQSINEEDKDIPCDETMPVLRLTAIRPDASRIVIFETDTP